MASRIRHSHEYHAIGALCGRSSLEGERRRLRKVRNPVAAIGFASSAQPRGLLEVLWKRLTQAFPFPPPSRVALGATLGATGKFLACLLIVVLPSTAVAASFASCVAAINAYYYCPPNGAAAAGWTWSQITVRSATGHSATLTCLPRTTRTVSFIFLFSWWPAGRRTPSAPGFQGTQVLSAWRRFRTLFLCIPKAVKNMCSPTLPLYLDW